MEKDIHLSKKNKLISGVCAGIGEYFGIDANIIRIIFILLGFIFHILPIIIVYGILWATIPSDNNY